MKTNLISCLITLTMLLSGCGSKTATLPVEAETAPAAATSRIELNAAQLQQSGIALAQAGPASLRDALPLYGTVTPDAERVREVAARYPGLIRTVSHKVGDSVREGDVLATVESNESLQTYQVRAPIAGLISERNAKVGEQATEKPLFVVVDLSSVWVELSLFPRDAAKVHAGQSASIRSPINDQVAEGKVTYVGPFGSRSNQTLTARVEIRNPRNLWTPGLYVNGEITLAERSAALVIEKSAVQILEGKPAVFVQEDGGFIARPVKLGRSDGTHAEILEGLAPGQHYVSTNSYVLKAELLKNEAAED
ncbi:MAG: efflux RND transporter periplasmic adaptor subunit [Pseudomonadota bacterium]